jgi:hypothetical protein
MAADIPHLVSVANHPDKYGKAAAAKAAKDLQAADPRVSHLLSVANHSATYGTPAARQAQAALKAAVTHGGTPAAPPGTPAQTQADVDKLNNNRDAATILTDLFNQYDLGTLAPQIVNYIKQGYSADAITVLLQQTPEYKQRFAANDIRIKAGLPALSPAEYIATERSYRQVMSAAGLPTGFYDSNSDFTSFLAKDISPTELKSRVDTATEAVNQAPKESLDYMKQWYNTGDLVAYALDPTKAQTLVEQRIKAAEAAGVGSTQGVNLTQQQGELIGATGVNLSQIQQGVGFLGQNLQATNMLDQIYGGDVTQDDLVKEVFQNDAAAAKKRDTLASKERAAFNGSGAAGGTALNAGQTDFNS